MSQNACYVAIAASHPAAAHRLAVGICRQLDCPFLVTSASAPLVDRDATFPGGVQYVEDADQALQESYWRSRPALSARLRPRRTEQLLPVVSTLWRGSASVEQLRPTLVIIWEAGDYSDKAAAEPDPIRPQATGPVARIEGDDYDSVLTEAIAAIRAVWPNLEQG